MKKTIINLFWGTIVCIALVAIFCITSTIILGMIMPNNKDYEALGTKLAIPIFIISIVITIKILKTGILPGTKKQP